MMDIEVLSSAPPQDNRIRLNGKKTGMLNPGRIANTVYPNVDENKMDYISINHKVGVNEQYVPSAQYGGGGSVYFPNTNLLGKFYLNIGLTVPAGTGYTQAVLPRNWEQRLVEQITLSPGANNQGEIAYHWENMFHTMVGQSSGAAELDFYCRQQGETILGTDFGTGGPPVWKIRDGKLWATMVLPILNSDWCTSTEERCYFDAGLLSSTIKLNIKFAQATAIFGNTYVPPVGEQTFVARIYYREGIFADPSESLRNVLKSKPNGVVSYPGFYYSPGNGTQVVSPTVGAPTQIINLQGFLNSDLYSMAFSFHLQSDIAPSAANSPACPFNTLPIYNIDLKYAGQSVYKVPDVGYELVQQESSILPVYLQNNYAQIAAGPSYRYGPTQNYVLFIDFSRLRAICGNRHTMPNTSRIYNQTLTLEVTFPRYFYYVDAGGTTRSVEIFGNTVLMYQTQYYPQLTVIDSVGTATITYS
jgi:hypothetical protein